MASSTEDDDVEEQARTRAFVEEAKCNNMNKNTIAKLLAEDYNSKEALSTMEDIDLAALKLTRAQVGLLKKWLIKIRKENSTQVKFEARREELHLNLTPPKFDDSPPDTLSPGIEEDEHDREETPQAVEDDGDVDNASTEEPSVYTTTPLANEATTVHIEEYITNLNIQTVFEEDIANHFQERGVLGLEQLLVDKLTEFMQCAVNIAVIGRTGTGKSSLINCLRNLCARETGAAKVGVTETTCALYPYAYPQVKGVILWDVPGHSTTKYPKDKYLIEIDFRKYDAFIIVCTDRVMAEDLWLAQEIHNPTVKDCTRRPFYFLRTKVDIDIRNNREQGLANENETLAIIRKNLNDELAKAEIPSMHVFIVSSVLRHQTRWDFPSLNEQLIKHTPQKNQTAMVLAMVSCTKDIIAKKKIQLKERVSKVVLRAVACEDQFQEIVREEIVLYTERMGVTKVDLDKWCIDTKSLDPRLQKIKRHLDLLLKWMSLEEAAVKFIIGGVNGLLAMFKMKILITEWEEKHKAKKQSAKDVAGERSFEAKREAAENALGIALDNCEELALGVLEARQLKAARKSAYSGQ